MKENKIKAILVIVLLIILFVLSSYSLYYLDNLLIQLISWIYVVLFAGILWGLGLRLCVLLLDILEE